jgi:hypothetical protein
LKVKTHMNRLKLNMIFSNFFIDTYFWPDEISAVAGEIINEIKQIGTANHNCDTSSDHD